MSEQTANNQELEPNNPSPERVATPSNEEAEDQQSDKQPELDETKETKLPRLQYSRDELMALKVHPLAILRPECFDPSKNKRVANLSCIKDFGQASAAPVAAAATGPGGRTWERGKQDSPPPADDPNAIVLGPERPRKVGDPRERIRKEQDGIVLSPQRRSFNSGCFVSGGGLAAGCGMGVNAVAPNAPRRPESPLGKADSRENQIREIPTRRIGSGRIMNRERESESSTGSGGRGWDFTERGASRMNERDDFSSFRERGRDERFERRSFGREFERNEKDRRAPGGRYGDRRHKDDEPEWFSGGPTSQHDTIELHGFDDVEGKKKKKQSTPPKAKSPAPPKDNEERNAKQEEEKKESEGTKGKENIQPSGGAHSDGFNIEDFLKQDIQNDFSQVFASGFNNEAPAEQTAGSRFSRFFKPESPHESRRSSIQDELIGNIMKDLAEPKVNIPAPGGAEAYFAPISPAAAGSSGPAADSEKSSNLLAMLQRGQQQDKNPMMKDLERSGRLHSVEELEAKMLQHNLNANRHAEQMKDQEAFQKLFMQASAGEAVGGEQASDAAKQDRRDGTQQAKPNPASRLSGRIISQGNKDIDPAMFGAYSEQQHQGQPHPQMHPPMQQQQPQQQQQQQMAPVPQEVLLKLLELQQQQQQQQRQQESKMMGHGRGIYGAAASPIPAEVQAMVHNVHPNHEMMMRPEAQNIMDGLRHGKLTVQHLVHQLHNQGNSPRIREMLAGVLKVHLQHQQQQARAVSPHVMAQQMRITSPMNGEVGIMNQGLVPTLGGVLGTSPVPPMQGSSLTVQHSGLSHRVPSPHELILHTRQIMQNALLKKKLEEQSENFRKQERQRAMSPANSKPSSSSPLAFTPTSVLRKMTAEKDFDAGAEMKQPGRPHMPLEPHSNWKPIEPVVPKPHQGRPIVKGGGGGFGGNNQQQPQYYPPEMGRMPQPNMMGMQRMPGGHKIAPPNPMQQQQQAFMNQQNMFQQQNREMQVENTGSSILLQQLLSGQRSINSINMAQQQPHGGARPLRGQHGDGNNSASLSQWFSGAGQMGAMPPIPTANTFSVEELERRQQTSTATPVHN